VTEGRDKPNRHKATASANRKKKKVPCVPAAVGTIFVVGNDDLANFFLGVVGELTTDGCLSLELS
jgi:hypothetical protein